MGFRLANVAGRAALVVGDHDAARYIDVAELSGGTLGPDPMTVIADPRAATELNRLAELAADSGSGRQLLSSGGVSATGAPDRADLGPPVPRPQKVFGVGLNYHDHATEGGVVAPDVPLVFTKFPSCIVGPHAVVELRGDRCDYEGELVVVIGPGGKDIARSDAWEHVFGLTVGQDVSDRRVQRSSNPPHFDLGKSFDTFGPTGPLLVSVDELADRDRLRIVTEVNGEVRQDGVTADMIFDVPTLVSYLSHITTLVPGDLIFTGTPAGVGFAQGRYLDDGDVVTTTIEGIGTMINRCVRVSDFPGIDGR